MSRQMDQVPVDRMVMVTAAQAGLLCGGMTAEWIRDKVVRGVIRPVPHSRQLMISRAELDRWATSNLDLDVGRQERAS